MACSNLEDILKSCDRNSGGIYEFIYADQDLITGYTLDEANHEITGITVSGTSSVFKSVQFSRNTGSYTETDTIDLNNGSSYTEQTISLVLHRRQGSISRALKLMGEGQRYLTIIIKDANGLYWYFDYAQLSSTGEGSGTAKADGSKYTVEFAAQSNQLAYEVDPSIIAGLL